MAGWFDEFQNRFGHYFVKGKSKARKQSACPAMLEPETINDFIETLELVVKTHADNPVLRNHLINADEVGINTGI